MNSQIQKNKTLRNQIDENKCDTELKSSDQKIIMFGCGDMFLKNCCLDNDRILYPFGNQ